MKYFSIIHDEINRKSKGFKIWVVVNLSKFLLPPNLFVKSIVSYQCVCSYIYPCPSLEVDFTYAYTTQLAQTWVVKKFVDLAVHDLSA